ncbi:MAG: adenylyl-sulfate reductase subunit alpha [Acutalibacteraceae bacterium]
METKYLKTDILIIGGGTAGCFAAITAAKQNKNISITIVEKADIKRSGCLAAGVNALNAYITKGHTPDFYVDYAIKDAHGIARRDLLLSMSEKLNGVTEEMEKLGLVILKDTDGEYVTRGNRNIKINGENFKPLLADAVKKYGNISVINNVNVIDLIVSDNRVIGAYGNSIKHEKLYVFSSKETIVCTGGASGIYKPNNPGFSRHKMWYCPFNTGAGYAMGIRAGAEMTTFEMRFIALRCKDTIAPTGTLAQGVGAKQINSLGEVYENKYGLTTSQRVWGTVNENRNGRGPCSLRTKGISEGQVSDLEKAYLNMAPSQTLKWISSGKSPAEENVEIEGTEPYIVGGHTASGYWIDNKRHTTLKGLLAAGDVAGGCPQKYVTGALAEGETAAQTAVEELALFDNTDISQNEISEIENRIASHLTDGPTAFTSEAAEQELQEIMDRYAGGISTDYGFTIGSLQTAQEKLKKLSEKVESIKANSMRELTGFYEVRERITVAFVLIAHLAARKETRWHCFCENLDYPQTDDEKYLKFINSVLKDGKIEIIERSLNEGCVLP